MFFCGKAISAFGLDGHGCTTFEICDCCGAEAGYTFDAQTSDESMNDLRREWLCGRDAKWLSTISRPPMAGTQFFRCAPQALPFREKNENCEPADRVHDEERDRDEVEIERRSSSSHFDKERGFVVPTSRSTPAQHQAVSCTDALRLVLCTQPRSE